jgi:hypothetical protein
MNKFTIMFENTNLNMPNVEWINKFGDIVKSYVKEGPDESFNKIKIKGNKEQIASFIEALKQERKYFLIAQKEGIKNRQIFDQEIVVKKAIENFEKLTKIPWPVR